MGMSKVIACFLLGLALPASAQDAVIASLMGKVSIRTEGEKRSVTAKAGDSLIYGDKIKTGPKSLAHILFPDGTAVLIKEDSRFTLEGNPQQRVVKFSIGEFLIGVKKKLTAGQSFKVRTPSAVAAVRGTLFWGKVNEDKSTHFAGLGHVIAVTAKGKTVIVKAGKKTSVAFGEPPAKAQPHDIPLEYANTFAVDGSLQGVETLVEK